MKIATPFRWLSLILIVTVLSGCYTKFSASRSSEEFLNGYTEYSSEPQYFSDYSDTLQQFSPVNLTIYNYNYGYSHFFRPYYSLSQWNYGWYDPFNDPLWPNYSYYNVWGHAYFYYGYPYYYPHANWHYYTHWPTWRSGNEKKATQNYRNWGRTRSGISQPYQKNNTGSSSRTVNSNYNSGNNTYTAPKTTTTRRVTPSSNKSTRQQSSTKKSSRTVNYSSDKQTNQSKSSQRTTGSNERNYNSPSSNSENEPKSSRSVGRSR